MININLIPPHLLKQLRGRELTDKQIVNSTPRKLRDEVLEWEGIIGYTSMICDALDDFNDAVVDPDQQELSL